MNSEQNDIVFKILENAINKLKQNQNPTKEWMTLKEGSIYAGVAVNTFSKFRLHGLKICEIDGVKRVSKAEIDNFLNEHSY